MQQLRYFDQRFSSILLLICLPLLFLPKINLIKLGGGETAGIRIDDAVLLLFGLVLFWGHYSTRARLFFIEKWILLLTGFALLSSLSNQLLVTAGILTAKGNPLYSLRLFEYFLFFYLGLLLMQHVRLRSFLTAFFLFNLVLMCLQRLDLIGTMSSDGYNAIGSYRVTGVTSFASEAGCLLNLLFCYFVFEKPPQTHFFPPLLRLIVEKVSLYFFFLVFGILIVMTGSRIALAALGVSFLTKLFQEVKKGSLVATSIAIVGLLGGSLTIALVAQKTDSFFKRSEYLFSFKNFKLIERVWDSTNIDAPPTFAKESFKEPQYDMSWWIRIHKWCYALKLYVSHPECWLQGVGPGFAGAALDGGFVRILTEYGIFGSVLFCVLFAHIYRLSPMHQALIIAFSFNMLFFDVYLAYKPMSLLFLMVGYAHAEQEAPTLGSYGTLGHS